MNSSGISGVFDSKSHTGVIFALLIASFVLPYIPFLNLVALPLTSFTTTIHEMSHAVACILTGGHVAGMSIISDGEGHGGLTYCTGGVPFVYAQAGYIGTALVGCSLIWLGRFPQLSKYVLVAIGAVFALGSAAFMFPTVLQGQIFAGLGSMLVGMSIGAAIIWVATRLNFYWANILLLFLGVQTALNAVNDDFVVAMQSFGMFGNTWSDATNMQHLTAVPAPIWAVLWTGFAGFLLYQTLTSSLKYDRARVIKTI